MKFFSKVSLLLTPILAFAVILTFGTNYSSALQEEDYIKNSSNQIFFYKNECSSSGYSTAVCGSTPREKYWSALRQEFDAIHAAAIFGSIDHEGSGGVARWEIGVNVTGDGGTFKIPWNTLYNNCTYTGACGGVGSFGITWTLTPYLHYVNDENPDLLKYFQDPSSYSFAGEETLKRIGDADYNRLVEQEVKYVMEKDVSGIDNFKAITDIDEATDWWTKNYENCKDCCGGADYDHSCEQIAIRRASARKEYEEMKDFACAGSSSSSSTASSSDSSSATADITLIGDSISVMSEKELEEKFPGSFLTMVGSRHSTSGGACAGDKGGLEILQRLAKGTGTILVQHHNKNTCDELTIDENSLKDNVVWELGTNSIGASKETIEKVIDLVGNKRKLFLVTPYNGYELNKASTEAIAQMYRDIAGEHDNVYIVEWAKTVDGTGYTYVYGEPGMTVHPTDEGKKLLARLINEAVSGSKGCTSYDGDYPEYIQWDEPWGSQAYGPNGKTIGNSGCGAASMAMLATVATGQDIYPNDIADLLGDKWYWNTSVHENDPIVGEHYGFEVIKDSSSTEEETKTKFRQYLNDGYMIHFTGAGCHPGFQGEKCSEGHVIGIFSIDGNDNVMQANSAYGGNQESSLDDIAKAKTWDAFTAIKGSGSSGPCNSTCKNSNISIGKDGLTEEQAQKVADYYNGSSVTAANFIGKAIPSTYQKVNCVSFSLWFVSAFTDASDEGATFGQLVGDGSYIADTGLPSLGWKTGNNPTPFSVFGGTGSSAWSHTGVVVGTKDDNTVITIEAAYGVHDAKVMTRPLSYFAQGVGILAYPEGHLTPSEGHLGNKSLNEIIGN